MGGKRAALGARAAPARADEQALRAGDPRFADAVRATDPRVHYKRRVIAAAFGLLIGTGLLLAGVVINVIPVAVAGFVVMLASSLWAVTSDRRMTGITTGRARPGQALWQEAARRQGPAGWQAGGIGADGAAGGTLAAAPGARPLNSRLAAAGPLAADGRRTVLRRSRPSIVVYRFCISALARPRDAVVRSDQSQTA
jgi:hypothetical protein